MTSASMKPHPLLRFLHRLPALLPAAVHNTVLVSTLNVILKSSLEQGELDFLVNRTVRISVRDIAVDYCISLRNGRIVAVSGLQEADLVLSGSVYDFLLLASRQEDSDTLFFSRRLGMQGNTELGLAIKNFLDGLDIQSHRFAAITETVLQRSLPIYERLNGKPG